MIPDPVSKDPADLIDHRAYRDSNIIEIKINGVWVKATPEQVLRLSNSLTKAAKHADSTTPLHK
jgi:hypothetical protein